MPPQFRRCLAPIVALLAVLAVTVPVGAAARAVRACWPGLHEASRGGRPGAETAAIARKIERGPGRSVQVLRGPRLLAVRVRRSDASALRRRLERIPGVRFVERNRGGEPPCEHELRPDGSERSALARTVGAGARRRACGLEADEGITERGDRRARHRSRFVSARSAAGAHPRLRRGQRRQRPERRQRARDAHRRNRGRPGRQRRRHLGRVPRLLDHAGEGAPRQTGWSTGLQLASGITWATDHGADVISISLAGRRRAPPLPRLSTTRRARACSWSRPRATTGTRSRSYPAGYPGVLSVAGTEPDDKLYPWSTHGSWVQVAAPGCDVTTFADGYGRFCGTSASTPVVAGLAGLALSYAPTASAAMVRQPSFPAPAHSTGSPEAASTPSPRSPHSERSSSPRRRGGSRAGDQRSAVRSGTPGTPRGRLE